MRTTKKQRPSRSLPVTELTEWLDLMLDEIARKQAEAAAAAAEVRRREDAAADSQKPDS